MFSIICHRKGYWDIKLGNGKIVFHHKLLGNQVKLGTFIKESGKGKIVMCKFRDFEGSSWKSAGEIDRRMRAL